MGKKKTLKLSSLLLKNTEIIKSSSSSSSFWPSCHQPKTLSFRANNKDNTFKTINSAYLDTTMNMLETSEPYFTVSPDNSPSFSTTSEEESKKPDSIETVIRGLRSDRLFFEPDETNSILQLNKSSSSSSSSPSPAVDVAASVDENGTLVFKDSVVLSMESQDPYVDFRKSMEEMVAAHDVKDWECLQELLCWYLKVNEKSNHGYIVGAFVDLLVGLAFASANSSSSFSSSYSSSTSLSPSSPLSFYSSSLSSSCLEVEEEVVPSSSLLLEQVSEEINHQDEPSSFSRSS